MREMIIKSLTVTNFMAYAEKTFTFGKLTSLSGMNGVGKSTVVTAYNWLFFNCDYELKDNPPIRREVDGVSIDDIDTSVSAVVEIDGKEIAVRKVQKRKYSKDGTSYKDDNVYYINEAAKTLTAYNEYFDIDMNVFKMCSNVNAFLAKKPAEMREYLFTLAESKTDYDIASAHEELAELLPLLNKYTRDEVIALNKKAVSDIKAELPVLKGQISEKERDIQIKNATDKGELLAKQKEIEDRLKTVADAKADNDKLSSEYQALSDGILELKFKQNEIEEIANIGLIAKRDTLKQAISDTKSELSDIQNECVSMQKTIDSLTADIDRKNRIRNMKVEEWQQAKDRKFDENSLVCPYCKRKYDASKKEEMRADFDAHKAEKLRIITDAGMSLKADIESITAEIEEYKGKIEEKAVTANNLRDEIVNLTENLNAIPDKADVSDNDTYKALQAEIEKKETLLKASRSMADVRANLKAEEITLNSQLIDIKSEMAKLDTVADTERLAELEKQYKVKDQMQTDAEKILKLIKELDKCKNEELSDEINSHFGIVKWKLWELSKGGEYKNVCVPMVDGKSILSTMSNKGNRILGRIDICRSLQSINGFICPIWLDDAESLDVSNRRKLAETVGRQLILLIVNGSEKLEIAEG
jgi:DNA repair exonuclease SbcCD ATPase subunit